MRQLIKEKMLVHRVQTMKDGEAFGELYEMYVAPIYRYIVLKVPTKEQAEDIASDTFLKAWQYLTSATTSQVTNFRAFIYRVARNTIIDMYRARTKQKELSLTEAAEVPDMRDISGAVSAKQDEVALMQTLKKLKQEYQEVIFLRYVEECSVREIATILDKSQTAIRVTLHRAVKKLKVLTKDAGTL